MYLVSSGESLWMQRPVLEYLLIRFEHRTESLFLKKKKMLIAELTTYLETLAPPSLQEDYDNSGLQVGELNIELQGALLCMDITKEVLEEAVSRDANLIISHHPLLFRGIKRIGNSDEKGQIIIEAIRKGITLYSIHTNLDNVPVGVNLALAKALGLQKPRIMEGIKGRLTKLVVFCPVSHAADLRQALFDAGCGHIGNYDSCSFNIDGKGTFRALDGADPFVGDQGILHEEPEVRMETILPDYKTAQIIKAMLAAHPYEEVAYDLYPLSNTDPFLGAGMMGVLPSPMPREEFLAFLRLRLNLPVIKHSHSRLENITRVAVCGGSGSFLIQSAMRQGADAFVSSDIKYHQFQEPGNGMLLCDIGHYESERLVLPHLAALLAEKFPNFAILVSERDSNPVKVFI
jgi:dinuclear metal center YbgI/SA1388 family protein